MIRLKFAAAAATTLCLLAGSALAAEGDHARGTGYLTGETQIDSTKFLPPPPALGSVQAAADQDIFLRMRTLEGTARWKLATADDDLSTEALMKDFSCALGVDLDKKNAPKFFALVSKAANDAGAAIGSGKDFFKRPRPLQHNDLPLCVPHDKYAKSFSYPSGHSTISWTFASILMAVAPDKAGAIAARARGYGESRAVCGVHWASDVEAGRLAASTVFAALQGNKVFQRDLKAAQAEIASLRHHAPTPDAAFCKVQDLATQRPW